MAILSTGCQSRGLAPAALSLVDLRGGVALQGASVAPRAKYWRFNQQWMELF
jgi:hypothetical protein